MKKVILILVLIVSIACLSMGTDRPDKKLNKTVERIASLYLQRAKALDSFLLTYPTYIYDSNYTIRQKNIQSWPGISSVRPVSFLILSQRFIMSESSHHSGWRKGKAPGY